MNPCGDISGTIFDIKRYAIHDGPGIRTTVFLKGCPLRCAWCHNPESYTSSPDLALRTARCTACLRCIDACPQTAISHTDGKIVTCPAKCTTCGSCVDACLPGAREIIAQTITASDVVTAIKKDAVFYEESGGGATFSGGEPLMQPDFLTAALKACKAHGIHTAVDTTCHADWQIIEQVAPYTDLFLCDIKHADCAEHKRLTGLSNELILENITRLADSDTPIIIRIPIIGGFNDDDKNIQATARLIADLKGRPETEILQYNPGGIEKAQRLLKVPETTPFKTPTPEQMQKIAKTLTAAGIKVKHQ